MTRLLASLRLRFLAGRLDVTRWSLMLIGVLREVVGEGLVAGCERVGVGEYQVAVGKTRPTLNAAGNARKRRTAYREAWERPPQC